MNVSCQLAYNTTGGGRLWRKFNSINLAWWHTVKHASFKIWKEFSQRLLAPWWHEMYPNGQFHVKPSSYPNVQAHLLLLHMSYPKLKWRIQQTMLGEDMQPRYKTFLADLVFLFEFAIPTVHIQPHAYEHTVLLRMI